MRELRESYKKKIINSLMENTIQINFPSGDFAPITEDNIVSESMTLKQSICDEEQLRFGGCISSEFKIQVINTEDRTFGTDLVGKWISVVLTQTFPNGNYLYPKATLYPSNNLFPGEVIANKDWYIFCGYIDSAKVDQNNKNIRNIVAYDFLSILNNLDGTDKLFELWKSFPNGCTMRNLLVHCLHYNGVVTVPTNFGTRLNETLNSADYTTVNDYLTMNKSWLENHNKITYGHILRDVCEMLGVFGFIRPNKTYGEFNFISTVVTGEVYDCYESFYAEEYTTKGYSGVQLMIGIDSERTSKIMTALSGYIDDNGNYYDLTDNVICWQEKESTEFIHPFNDMYNGRITDKRISETYIYTPITATVDCRLWVEPGDKVIIKTPKTDVYGNYLLDGNGNVITEDITSFVFSRTITGIKALTDKIEAKGVQ